MYYLCKKQSEHGNIKGLELIKRDGDIQTIAHAYALSVFQHGDNSEYLLLTEIPIYSIVEVTIKLGDKEITARR